MLLLSALSNQVYSKDQALLPLSLLLTICILCRNMPSLQTLDNKVKLPTVLNKQLRTNILVIHILCQHMTLGPRIYLKLILLHTLTESSPLA